MDNKDVERRIIDSLFSWREVERRIHLNYVIGRGLQFEKTHEDHITVIVNSSMYDWQLLGTDDLDSETKRVCDTIHANQIEKVNLNLSVSAETKENAEINEERITYLLVVSRYKLIDKAPYYLSSNKAAYAAAWTYVKKLRRELNNYFIYPTTSKQHPALRLVNIDEAVKIIKLINKTIESLMKIEQTQIPTPQLAITTDEEKLTSRIQALIQQMKQDIN
ncbi:MAG: hypothetical protein QXQ33_00790 [Nitrososphaerota archaeon]